MKKESTLAHTRARFVPAALALIAWTAAIFASGLAAQEPPRRPTPAARVEPLLRPDHQGWLGIRVDEWIEDPRSGRTILTVLQVEPGSPAARAGMRSGDRLVSINGLDASTSSIRALTRALRTGDTVRLRVRRASTERDMAIVAASRPLHLRPPPYEAVQIHADSLLRVMRVLVDSMALSVERADAPEFRLVRPDSQTMIIVRRTARGGMTDTIRFAPGQGIWMRDSVRGPILRFEQFFPQIHLDSERPPLAYRALAEVGFRSVAGAEFTEMNPGLAAYFDGTTQGLLTLRVADGTPAERAGLEPGDVVIAVDGRPVHTVFELRAAMARGGEDGVRVELVRKGTRHEIRLAGRR